MITVHIYYLYKGGASPARRWIKIEIHKQINYNWSNTMEMYILNNYLYHSYLLVRTLSSTFLILNVTLFR